MNYIRRQRLYKTLEIFLKEFLPVQWLLQFNLQAVRYANQSGVLPLESLLAEVSKVS